LLSDIGHFIVDTARQGAHQVKRTFSRATNYFKHVFQDTIVKQVLIGVTSGLLVLGGAALFFGGFIPPVNILAASMVGAGLSGITYLATAKGNVTYEQWAIHLGIGAAVGAVTGSIGVLGGSATNAAAEFAAGLVTRVAAQAVARTLSFAAAAAVRIAGTIAFTSMSNAAGATLSQFLGNLDTGKSLTYGLGSAATLGVVTGALAGATVGTMMTTVAGVRTMALGLMMRQLGVRGSMTAAFVEELAQTQKALSSSPAIGFFALPGIIFRGVDIAADEAWHPAW
jgi:hypothetical protein